jgi:methylase of polypeptide subunit release factors
MFAIVDGLIVLLDDEVPIPGIDTVALAVASDSIVCKDALVIGCGAGLLALRLAQRRVSVLAVDISEPATRLCQRNTHINCSANYVKTLTMDIRASEVNLGSYDIVVCNPPQLPRPDRIGPSKDSWISIANDGGPDGREFIDWLTRNASRFLRPSGCLLFTHFDILGTTATIDVLEAEGFQCVERATVTKPVGALSSERLARIGYTYHNYTVKVIEARLSR